MRIWCAGISGAAGAALLVAVAGTALAAQSAMTSPYLDESALVFRASDLKSGQLPARIHLRNLPPVFSSQVTLACLGLPLQADELVVYLAESKSCMTLRDRTPASFAGEPGKYGPEVTRGLAQERASLEQQLESSPLVVMQPRVQAVQQAALCYCPGNDPPVASVQSGSPQQVSAGAAIAPIWFDATDSDSPTLTHEFFHTLDGGLQQAGLPGGLGEACSAGSGTLSCSVTGSAPLAIGSYLIQIEVHDGSSSASATAELTVVDGVKPETVFSNGFEDG
jgi:hypothetical protein